MSSIQNNVRESVGLQMFESSTGVARPVDAPVRLVLFKGDRPQLDKTARHSGHSSNQVCRACTISVSEVLQIGHQFDVLANRRRKDLQDKITERIDNCRTKAGAKAIRSQTGSIGGKVCATGACA